MSLNGDISILIEAVNKTAQPFNEVQGELEQLRDARVQANRVVFEQQRAEALLTQQFRYQYRAVYDSAELMTRVGSIGMTLLQITNSRALAELRLSDAVDGVAEAEEWVNKMRELYGEDSVQYKDAVDGLTKAHKDLKEAEDAHDQTEWSNFLTGVGALGVSIQTIMKGLEFIKNGGGIAGILGGAGLAAIKTTIGDLALAFGAGGFMVAFFSWLESIAPPDTPSTMSGFLPDDLQLTKEEMEAGMTYEEKYAQWREEQLQLQSSDEREKANRNKTTTTTKSTPSSVDDVVKIDFVTDAENYSAYERDLYLAKAEKQAAEMGFDAATEDAIERATQSAMNKSTTSSTTKTIIQNNTIEVKQLTTVDDLGKLVSEIASITRQAAKEGY